MAERQSAPGKPLTEVELELMNILWRLGGGSVNDVLAALPADRPLAYTSVSTILRILEQKGVLASEKVGRGHRYLPLLDKPTYEAFAVTDVVGKLFDGQPLALVRRLVDASQLSRKDLAALKALLDEKDGAAPARAAAGRTSSKRTSNKEGRR
jgi:predicted transcriptional regulator